MQRASGSTTGHASKRPRVDATLSDEENACLGKDLIDISGFNPDALQRWARAVLKHGRMPEEVIAKTICRFTEYQMTGPLLLMQTVEKLTNMYGVDVAPADFLTTHLKMLSDAENEATPDELFKQWLHASPKQPAKIEMNKVDPLYWELENVETRLTSMERPSNYVRFIGLSGSGKTRTLYEECVHHVSDGIYVTMKKAANGGSRAAERMLERVDEAKLAGDSMCCMLMGMLYAHVKFCFDHPGDKLTRLFLMTQNCGDMIVGYCNRMPIPHDYEQARKWMQQMTIVVEGYESRPCIMLDEIQTVQDLEVLKQLVRAVEKLVTAAVVTGTGVQKEVLQDATERQDSAAGKLQWKDATRPLLCYWSRCQKYMNHHLGKTDLSEWLEQQPQYKQWFDPCRARLLAILVEKCRNNCENKYEEQLEDLHELVCNPTEKSFLLNSNFNEHLRKNLNVMTGAEKSIARHLAEYLIRGEIHGKVNDHFLEHIIFLGVGNCVGKLEVLAVDCLKRMERIVSLIPQVIKEQLEWLGPSSAGFMFEYPVAYAIAGVDKAEDLSFLHWSLADSMNNVGQLHDGWHVAMPDRFAGPDVVLFHVKDCSVTELKVVQSKLVASKLSGVELDHAYNTTDLKRVYTRRDSTVIMTKLAERRAIKAWFMLNESPGMKVTRVLVCSGGVSFEHEQVQVFTDTASSALHFLGRGLWDLLPR